MFALIARSQAALSLSVAFALLAILGGYGFAAEPEPEDPPPEATAEIDEPDAETTFEDEEDDYIPPPPPEPKLEILPGQMNRSIGIPVNRGFWLGSADRRFSIRLSGFSHLDFRGPIDTVSGDDYGFPLARRSRFALEGNVFGDLEYRALIDAAIGLMPIDLFVDWRHMPEFNVRVGRFKSPFGFERRMRAYAILFNERGFPTSLAPNRDFGLFIHGQTREGFFSYDVALLGGAGDLESITFFRGTPEFAARIYFQPFRLIDVPELRHLGLGFSATIGSERGAVDDPRLGRVQTVGRRNIFRYRAADEATTAYADGSRDRWSLHGHWRYERYLAIAEFVSSTQRVRLGENSRRLTHRAWQASFSAMLTDDEHGFFGVKPRRPFNPSEGDYGAASLAVRYQEIYFDTGIADGFVDDTFAVDAARSFTVSGQWHINYLLELQADFEYTAWSGGSVGPLGGQGEFAFVLRLEARY